jgi:hypothetical protein
MPHAPYRCSRKSQPKWSAKVGNAWRTPGDAAVPPSLAVSISTAGAGSPGLGEPLTLARDATVDAGTYAPLGFRRGGCRAAADRFRGAIGSPCLGVCTHCDPIARRHAVARTRYPTAAWQSQASHERRARGGATPRPPRTSALLLHAGLALGQLGLHVGVAQRRHVRKADVAIAPRRVLEELVSLRAHLR